MKGYNVDSTFKDKLKNEFNSEYGINLKKEKESLENSLKPRRIVNSDFIKTKR